MSKSVQKPCLATSNGKEWEQFTYIFVIHIACCLLDSNPQPFVMMWGIGNCEFHTVLYISCNFHQTFILSEMAQCPSP